jgi:hypothetical protein
MDSSYATSAPNRDSGMGSPAPALAPAATPRFAMGIAEGGGSGCLGRWSFSGTIEIGTEDDRVSSSARCCLYFSPSSLHRGPQLGWGHSLHARGVARDNKKPILPVQMNDLDEFFLRSYGW